MFLTIFIVCGALFGICVCSSMAYNLLKEPLKKEKEIKTPLADQYLKDGFTYVNIDGDRIRVPPLSKEEEEIASVLQKEAPPIVNSIEFDQRQMEDYNNDFLEAYRVKLLTQKTYCTTGTVVQNFKDDVEPITEGQLKKLIEREQQKQKKQSEIDWINKQEDIAEVSAFYFNYKDELDRELILIPSIKDCYLVIRGKMEKIIRSLDGINSKLLNLENRYK